MTGFDVHEHKTGQQGPARLTMDHDDKRRLDDYVLYVQPGLDPHNKLFSLSGGRPLEKNGKLLAKVETNYNLSLPSCTQLRKELATKAALTCSSAEVALLSRQINHSIETHRRAYEEIGTTSHAAQAHSLVQRLLSKDVVKEKPKRSKKMLQSLRLQSSNISFNRKQEMISSFQDYLAIVLITPLTKTLTLKTIIAFICDLL